MKPVSAPASTTPEIKFFWYEEESEVWAALDLQSFNEQIRKDRHISEELRKHMPHWEPVPDFTEANKGTVWGESNHDDTVIDEDRGEITFREAAKDAPSLPWQISTQYN